MIPSVSPIHDLDYCRLSAAVFGFEVPLHVCPGRKRSPALAALVGLFSGVGQEVPLQRVAGDESHVAVLALVTLLSGVDHLVGSEK